MENNTFIENIAYQGGGILINKIMPINFLKKNYFFNNFAQEYGDSYASAPHRIIFKSKNYL